MASAITGAVSQHHTFETLSLSLFWQTTKGEANGGGGAERGQRGPKGADGSAHKQGARVPGTVEARAAG